MFTSELSSDCSVLSEHIAGPSTSTPKLPCPPLEEISLQDISKNTLAKITASLEAFQRRVFPFLEEIKEEQKELRAMFSSNFSKGKHNTELPPDCPGLPCTSPEELVSLHSYLEDTKNFSLMFTHDKPYRLIQSKICKKDIKTGSGKDLDALL
ncbi:hypothetical protein AVEN_200046-1 [Araneus ventricosus]|uniref:Uncharacterized protein n=1 Tax=Araneus ventricosus TaxID=182803 RepID=A0A4Y2T753_ARAVE|nr:hypothetical protein AVEN_200046-1 [Araneus ventricosus]